MKNDRWSESWFGAPPPANPARNTNRWKRWKNQHFRRLVSNHVAHVRSRRRIAENHPAHLFGCEAVADRHGENVDHLVGVRADQVRTKDAVSRFLDQHLVTRAFFPDPARRVPVGGLLVVDTEPQPLPA